MELHQITEARKIFNACGFRHTDKSGLYVPIPRGFLLPMVVQPNQTAQWTKEIIGKTPWALRAISCDQGLSSLTGVRLQIQLPSGRFIFGGNGIDVGQFAWVGSYRYWMPEEQDMEPGSRIAVSLSDTNTGGLANPLPVNLVFEGAYKYYYQGIAAGETPKLATQVPRYQGIVNENILAPCWMAGYGPETPAGYTDDYFIYSFLPNGSGSPTATIPLTGPLATSATLTVDSGLDFIVRRVCVDIEPGAAVTAGSILMRLRTGDGYALMDDYIDVAKYLGGAEWLGQWTIRGGDQVTADLALVDGAGAGSVSFTVHLEGVKRKQRKSA